MKPEIISPMTTTEARRLVAEIKTGVASVGEKLLELYEREGWRVLGYPNWRECVMAELDFEKSHVYELLNFAKVTRNLSAIAESYPLPTSEAQTRVLASLTPEQQREVWAAAVDSALDGQPTAADVNGAAQAKNYKRDAQRSRKADKNAPQGMDACQTPAYALDPLLPYLGDWVIWEPAAGEGLLVQALYDSGFRQSQVVYGDLLTGQNFFDYQPDRWDCLITNPPYSIQFDWLKRCYELDKPFALLLKVEVLGTKQAQKLFAGFGVEVIFVSPRINFKMPNKGWDGAGAQFAVAWFTHGLHIGQQMTFVEIKAEVK